MKDIFKKAVDWYIKGNDYRRAALELYDATRGCWKRKINVPIVESL